MSWSRGPVSSLSRRVGWPAVSAVRGFGSARERVHSLRWLGLAEAGLLDICDRQAKLAARTDAAGPACGSAEPPQALALGTNETPRAKLHDATLVCRADATKDRRERSKRRPRTAVASHSGLRRECYALLCEGAQARFCRKSANALCSAERAHHHLCARRLDGSRCQAAREKPW